MDLVGEAVDPRGDYVSKVLHVKTKESGPVGGAPLDPSMGSIRQLSLIRRKIRQIEHSSWEIQIGKTSNVQNLVLDFRL